MEFELSTQVDASPDDVWAVVADVESWPSVTDSMDEVRVTSEGAFGVGSTAKVKQPKIPLLTWTVTDWREGRSFVWQTSSLGVTIVASHDVRATSDGTRLTLGIDQHGLLSPLAQLMTGKRAKQYVQMELAGTKRAAEERARSKS
ncbi:SRPBCC family protein [Solicola gregarius]|uniref:SRPBCC family protein n=1 Tax=Solicola gregarius TaxID=2908642 RepID=A0AA46YME5_9ACTN|nr:SRPBCC family protein [Solicola gregarius]UYM07662.1 SRPBCC family protein [Solicola gregarius]